MEGDSVIKITVFLVEDQAATQEGLALLLGTQADISIIGSAGEPAHAMGEVHRLQPDIVIASDALPDWEATAAIRSLREAAPAARIIVLSLHAEREYLSRAIRAGARGYLLSETVGLEVVAAVRAVQAGEIYLSPRRGHHS
jgi:two-component system, NarL family, response regulator NreC